MNKSEIDELREALMEAHIGDSSESLEELKYYNTPNPSPENTRPEAFAPISMGSQRPITGNKRSRSTSGLSLAELQKQLGHHSDSSDDEMKEYNLEKKKKRKTVKLRGKTGGKRKRNRKKRTKRRGKSKGRKRRKLRSRSRKKRGGINKLFPRHLLSVTGRFHYDSSKFISRRLNTWWASISIERQENIINGQHNHFAFESAMDDLIALAVHEEQQQQQNQQGGHAGNSSSSDNPRQPNYEELAAMRNGNPHRVYYLYMVNTNYDPPLEQAIGNGFIHRFKYNDNGDKIAITGHPVNNSNSTAYTIPNPHHHTMSDPSAEQVLNFFYNPAQGARREFRDISDMMGNLQMAGRRKRRKSRRRMRGKRKGKTRRKRRR
jgi:hypothetical protein